MRRIWHFLCGHPLGKGIGIAVFGIIGNVLAGAYVFEITKTDPKSGQFLDWWSTPHSRSFWALVVIVILMGLYTWVMARADVKTRTALMTDANIRQRVLEELLGPLLERAKEEIRAGNMTSMEEVEKMFGIAKRGKE